MPVKTIAYEFLGISGFVCLPSFAPSITEPLLGSGTDISTFTLTIHLIFLIFSHLGPGSL